MASPPLIAVLNQNQCGKALVYTVTDCNVIALRSISKVTIATPENNLNVGNEICASHKPAHIAKDLHRP
jgi:hypothetical protein